MLIRTCLSLLILLVASAADAQPQQSSLPAGEPMPREALTDIVRGELGELYKAADAERYLEAHQLIERYFASSAERRQVVAGLEGLGLDPNIIGRLVRVRAGWPALAAGVYYINERIGPHDVRYFLGVPKGYDRARSWPLVIKLPVADAFVSDPRPDAEQVTQIYSGWIAQELTDHPDAVVIMPLLHLDELWGPSYAGMNGVMQPMQHVAGRVNVDPARVYLVGHGMSAHATWNLALHFTTYFASFSALAGGASADWQRLRAMNLRTLNPVAWHDENDAVVKVDSSRQLVRVLRGLRVPVTYIETKGIGHTPTPQIAQQVYQQMRQHTRALYPPAVAIQSNRPDALFNRNDWVQIYQPLNPGGERRLLFSRGSGHMLLNTSPSTIEASFVENTITVTSRNVESMRFYLNDQMVNFSKPIKVILNRRARFEGIVKPSVEAMLKDHLFIGRGWRYYTGVIDLDFGAPAAAPTTRP